MKLKTGFLIVGLFLLSNCDFLEKSSGQPLPTTTHDYELAETAIYAQVIPETFASHTFYVIERKAGCLLDVAHPEEFKQILAEVGSDTLTDYIAKINQPQFWPDRFIENKNVMVINEADYWLEVTPDVIPYCAGPGSLSLEMLQSNFPQAQGVIHLSPIGFSDDRKQALVCVGLNVGGCHTKVDIILLHKDHENWETQNPFQIEQMP